MRLATRSIALLFLTACLNLGAPHSQATGQEPNWYPSVIVRGSQRTIIQQTPIHLRPYRPLHFYGNTQRRSYYRGNPLPRFRDFQMTGRQLITRANPAAEPVFGSASGPVYGSAIPSVYGSAYRPVYGSAYRPVYGSAYRPVYGSDPGPPNYRIWR